MATDEQAREQIEVLKAICAALGAVEQAIRDPKPPPPSSKGKRGGSR